MSAERANKPTGDLYKLFASPATATSTRSHCRSNELMVRDRNIEFAESSVQVEQSFLLNYTDINYSC